MEKATKIGVSSYSFAKHLRSTRAGYGEVLRIAKEIGFDGVEFIDLDQASWGEEGNESEIAKRVREEADRLGLEIPAYTILANFLENDLEAECERLCASLDVAKLLGAKVFRHDAATSLRQLPGYTWETAMHEMAPYIRRVAEYGASLGIRTSTENHGGLFQDAVRVEELMRTVNHPNYGWLVDMGNFVVTDGDPLASVRRAAPYAVHVHAKDFILKDDSDPRPVGFIRSRGGRLWRGTTLGHGMIPVAECVKALLDAGYTGWFSLEFEGQEDNLPAIRHGFEYLTACVNAALK